MFELHFKFQHWQFSSMLKRYVNVESIGKILSVQHLQIFSTLSQIVKVEIWNGAQASMLKFNVEGLKACQNQPLGRIILSICHRSESDKKTKTTTYYFFTCRIGVSLVSPIFLKKSAPIWNCSCSRCWNQQRLM